MKKRIQKMLVAILLLIFIIPLSTMVLNRIVSSTKLNSLFESHLEGIAAVAQKPMLNTKTWLDKDFQQQYSKWFEQNIGFREFMVRMNNQLYYSIFKKSYMYDNKIVIGKNNQLFEKIYIDDYTNVSKSASYSELEKLSQKILEVQNLYKKKGTEFIVLISPNKAYIYPEYLPDAYIKNKKGLPTDYDQIKTIFNKIGINYVDGPQITLGLKKKVKEPLFCEGATHWNELTVSYIIEELRNKLSKLEIKIPKLETEKVYVDNKPFGTDKDLAELLNLYYKPINYKSPHVMYKQIPDTNKHTLTVVGDSFASMPCWVLSNYNVIQNIDLLYYYSINLNKYSKGNQITENVDIGSPLIWQEYLMNKDIVILEINQSFFLKPHIEAFLNDSIKYLNDDNALDNNALKCSLKVVSIPESANANEQIPVEIIVTNTSNKIWSSNVIDNVYPILLGYHIYEGDKYFGENRISYLPHDVLPGQEVTLKGYISAISKPGKYTLKIDMLQENYKWFENINNNIPLVGTISIK